MKFMVNVNSFTKTKTDALRTQNMFLRTKEKEMFFFNGEHNLFQESTRGDILITVKVNNFTKTTEGHLAYSGCELRHQETEVYFAYGESSFLRQGTTKQILCSMEENVCAKAQEEIKHTRIYCFCVVSFVKEFVYRKKIALVKGDYGVHFD